MPKIPWQIKSLLLLAFLLASWQFVAGALAQTVITSADAAGTHSIIDGTACKGLENENRQPLPQGNSSSDSSTDIDDNDTELDDLSAEPSTLDDQNTLHFSVTGVDAGATRTPGIVRVILLPVHCFYCLHAHIRERAPPRLA